MSSADSFDTPDLSAHGSHLLSLPSPSIPSQSERQTDDLSFSELFISEPGQPFSLLAKPKPPPPAEVEQKSDSGDEIERPQTPLQKVEEKNDAHLQQEKLQSDMFILKKLNAAFESFNEALKDTHTANERIAIQLEQTDALLNKYIDILSKSEDVARLIFDEGWQGAEADEQIIEEERQKVAEKARREAEAERLRKQQERERLEREKEAEMKKVEKERIEREKTERAGSRGVRGVRGTRGTSSSTRGVPVVRGTASSNSRIARSRPSALPRPAF